MENEPTLALDTKFIGLSTDQQRQVMMQLKKHEHGRYITDIALSETEILNDFVVYPEVLRPESMTSLYLARHLYEERQQHLGKLVMDIGCGSGIQGITMGIGGAEKIILADISPRAVSNAMENINKFQLSDKAKAVQSDLFANVEDTADVIVFNHPFFPSEPIKDKPVSVSMLDTGSLIHRFLKDSKLHLRAGGRIIMPYLQLAGETNDPEIQAPKHGFKVNVVVRQNVDAGLQKGLISIYHLEIEK